MVAVPDRLSAEYMAQRWPRLYHMAEAGSWLSIQRHGLLSTSALLDLFEVHGGVREQLEARRRPESVPVRHPVHGTAWIRDNKPINETVLRRTLTGMTEPEFYRLLNGRVFMWLTQNRLAKLQAAPPYRGRPHDVLIIRTDRLLERYGDRVELSHLNSGAVHPAANYPRGSGTFTRIADYPWQQRLSAARAEPIVELTVPYAVPDIADLVVEVQESKKHLG